MIQHFSFYNNSKNRLTGKIYEYSLVCKARHHISSQFTKEVITVLSHLAETVGNMLTQEN